MNDILIRNIEPELKRLIEDSARSHRRSLSEEVKDKLRKSFQPGREATAEFGLAARIRASIPAEAYGSLEPPPRDAGREPPDLS